MSLRHIAALIRLMEEWNSYDQYVRGGGCLDGSAEADALQCLINLIMCYQDYDLFLSVVRNPDWMQETLENTDGVSTGIMDVIVSEYIDIYENMTAGRVLEVSSQPHFRQVKAWMEEKVS